MLLHIQIRALSQRILFNRVDLPSAKQALSYSAIPPPRSHRLSAQRTHCVIADVHTGGDRRDSHSPSPAGSPRRRRLRRFLRAGKSVDCGTRVDPQLTTCDARKSITCPVAGVVLLAR